MRSIGPSSTKARLGITLLSKLKLFESAIKTASAKTISWIPSVMGPRLPSETRRASELVRKPRDTEAFERPRVIELSCPSGDGSLCRLCAGRVNGLQPHPNRRQTCGSPTTRHVHGVRGVGVKFSAFHRVNADAPPRAARGWPRLRPKAQLRQSTHLKSAFCNKIGQELPPALQNKDRGMLLSWAA
jgi:hypothetical protein